MRSRDVQRCTRITFQDPTFDAISRGRDSRVSLRRIPEVEDVCQVRIAGAGHGGENALAVVRDQVEPLLLVRHAMWPRLIPTGRRPEITPEHLLPFARVGTSPPGLAEAA